MKILVSGTIGVGKSTFIKKLKKYYIAQGKKVIVKDEVDFKEFVFKKYISEKRRYAYLFHFKQMAKNFADFFNSDHDDTVYIFDRSFLDVYLFAKIQKEFKLISRKRFKQFKIYFRDWKKIVISENYKFDYTFLFNDNFKNISDRIIKRKRDFENYEENVNYFLYCYIIFKSKKYQKQLQEISDNFFFVDAKEFFNKKGDDFFETISKFLDK